MRRHLYVLLAASAFTFAVVPTILAAQVTSPVADVSLPSPRHQVLSVQPLSAMFTVYSAEFEQRLTPTVTVGVGGTYWGDRASDAGGDANAHYASGDVKLRYYPGARSFQGFSFGVQGGFTRVSGRVADGTTSQSTSAAASGPTFGVTLDYNWLLGPSRAFYVGLGVGAKALFIDADEIDGATARYPTARISIGRAF